jgi:hypothetical protein
MIEGFDHVGTAIANVAQAGWVIGGTMQGGSALGTSRWGTSAGRYALTIGINPNIHKMLPVGFPEIWMGAAVQGGSRASAPWIYILNASGGGVAMISTASNASGFIQLHNQAGTVVASSSSTGYLYDGGWHYIEVRVLCAGAAGSAEVWMDGVQIIAPVTANFGTAGTLTSPAGVGFYASDSPSNATWWNVYADDVYFLDTAGGGKTTRLGECRVESLYPSADGAHLDFTPTTAGTHFDEVDDGAAGSDADTTTVQSNVVGARDSYAFNDLSISSGVIHGVGVKTVMRKNDVSPRTVKHSIRQAGTTYDGSIAHVLTAAHTCYQTVFDGDPVAAAWTVANVNADEYGVKVES